MTVGARITHEIDEGGIVHVILSSDGGRINLLTRETLEDMHALLEDLERSGEGRGVLLRGAGPGTFLAGMHLDEITAVKEAYRAAEAARFGQSVLAKLENLGIPSVCAIDGPCLGAGAELALACTFRIVSDRRSVRVGLPETRLGLIPGFGGTRRLARLVGLPAAADLLLEARRLDSGAALRAGLVDRIVPRVLLLQESAALLRRAAEDLPGTLSAVRARRPLVLRWAERIGPLRRFLLARIRRELSDRIDPARYPAPYRALEALDAAWALPAAQAMDLEARMVGELVPGLTSRNLIWLYRNRNALRKGEPGVRALPREVRKIGVVGAGAVGAGVACLAAGKEFPVRLADRNEEALLAALRMARRSAAGDAGTGRPGRRERSWKLGFLSTTTDLSGMGKAGLVVEAVQESLEAKHRVVQALERVMDDRAILVTTSATIPVNGVASVADRPERVIGLHFFHPVDRMQLVEMVAGPDTSPEAVSTAREFVLRLGKTPVSVKDEPGFLVGRILLSYLAEAVRLLGEGIRIELLDSAMKSFGLPSGPFLLIDRIGVEKVLRMVEVLDEAFQGRFARTVRALATLVSAGRRGREAGFGFYRYREGRPTIPDRETYNLLEVGELRDIPPETLQERLVLAMINEAARCLEEEIVREAVEIDLAMVLGAGFPAFRGGLLRHADSVGIPVIVDRMDRSADSLGERYRPAEILNRMVRSQRRFYHQG